MAITAPGADEPRVTLTAPALKAAYALHVLIIGDEKQAVFNRALKLPDMQAPIAAIIGQARVHWAP
jgi:6-phosphogluconolactonase